MILSLQQGLAQDGVVVSLVKLCRWFQIPRCTVYYRSTKSVPKVQEQLLDPIMAMIEENPSFGYRTVAHLLGFNKNTVQRSGVGLGAGPNCSKWLPGQGQKSVPVEVRQWPDFYQPQLHGAGQKLWAAAGVHHSLQP